MDGHCLLVVISGTGTDSLQTLLLNVPSSVNPRLF